MAILLNTERYQRARQARDARFDGLFFIGVKSTKIYCRPVCPARPALEKNVEYHDSAVSAAQAGFRPCLRCRPDSAPNSSAWRGNETTFNRAVRLIDQGALQTDFSKHEVMPNKPKSGSTEELADRLGISSRYLRQLFQQYMGLSPKRYAIYQQCLFAKKLLHESSLPISQIAFASGFNSIRRFNDAMREQLNLKPMDIRKNEKTRAQPLQLKLYYRPPYAWAHCHAFLKRRTITGLEWFDGLSYSRSIEHEQTKGYFTIKNKPTEHCLVLTLYLNQTQHLRIIVQRIKQIFDVDAPIDRIDQQLKPLLGNSFDYLDGLRVPGVWSYFEAGVRAILGQQVSVSQAHNLMNLFVAELGRELNPEQQKTGSDTRKIFPKPEDVVAHSLHFFRMPQARKDTIRRLADYCLYAQTADLMNIDKWLELKGIGPWTANYVKIRAASDPDIWLAGDAGIKNALKLPSLDSFDEKTGVQAAKPWSSYLTFQLWNQL